MAVTINASTSSGLVQSADNSGIIEFQSNGVTKATLNSSGFSYPSAVLQVVQASYNTEFSTTSNTFADIGLSASITPTSSSSKILVLYSVGYLSQDTNLGGIRLLRGSTAIQTSIRAASRDHASYFHNEYLDSPATTSSTTYKVQSNKNTGSAFLTCWNGEQPSSITLLEIAA